MKHKSCLIYSAESKRTLSEADSEGVLARCSEFLTEYLLELN